MQFPKPARNYLLKALAGNPAVLKRILGNIPADSPVWDSKPDPERFSLKEVLAHLADWEPIWKERFERLRDENHPFLQSIDEGELAITNNYAEQDPLANLARFAEGRVALVKVLETLTDTDWEQTGNREFVGPLTTQMLACLVLSHDGYHLHQAVEWTA